MNTLPSIMSFLGMSVKLGDDNSLDYVEVLNTDWTKGIITCNQIHMTGNKLWQYCDGEAKHRLYQYELVDGAVPVKLPSKVVRLFAYIYIKHYSPGHEQPWEMGEDAARWNQVLTNALDYSESHERQ